jgi:hypothetical protein
MPSHRREGVELIAALLLAAVSVLTLVVPDWIEEVFGLDPDAGSGAAEAGIVIACALAAAGLWLHRRSSIARVRRSHDVTERGA